MTAFRGLLAYPITPLTDDDAPDLDALGRLVRDA
ncbi:dihydrodipicolinate synthase family protein, partial [Cellulosimicrobium cellulans]|nr:dihydrodipicolinate synthase family protein [Cellulosimicrobium cellulans]